MCKTILIFASRLTPLYSKAACPCTHTDLRGVTGRRPRCIPWKCLRFWDTLTLNNSMDTKYHCMPQTNLTGRIFIPSVQVWAITDVYQFMIFSKRDFWIKLVFTLLLIPTDITACTRDGYRNWYHDWGHCERSPMAVVSFPGHHNDRNRGINFYSIMMHQTILNLCRFGCVYKQKLAHKTASNQPLWKAWPQTIVTADSLVTSWLPLWCHSDACVTKSWKHWKTIIT